MPFFSGDSGWVGGWVGELKLERLLRLRCRYVCTSTAFLLAGVVVRGASANILYKSGVSRFQSSVGMNINIPWQGKSSASLAGGAGTSAYLFRPEGQPT